MLNKLRPWLVLALVAGWGLGAAAQTIYRCGDSYSQKPCPGGKEVQADDPRSADQRAQTTQAVRRDAQAADAMEKARLKEEAKPAQALLPPPKATSAPAAGDRTDSSARVKKPAYFSAVSPKKPGATPAPKKKGKKPAS